MSIDTPEQLLQQYAATPQNRTAVAVIDRRIESLRDQLECCGAEDLARGQGAIASLRSLRRLLCGQPE